MKANRVFLATGLAFTMGASIALAGLVGMSKDIQPVKAGNPVTLYLELNSNMSWWNSDNAEVRAHCWGGGATSTEWPGAEMSLVTGTTNLYSLEIDDAYTSVIFTRVNPSDHTTVWNRSSKDNGTPITLPSDYTTENKWVLEYNGTNYDDGNYTGHWEFYDASNKHNVSAVLDYLGMETTTTNYEVVDGNTVPEPAYDFGYNFTGWYSDPNYTEGNEVTAVTSDMTVYGKINKVDTVKFTVDVSRAPDFSGKTGYALYAWEVNGHTNASWPGVDTPVWGKPELPVDASLIISHDSNVTENRVQTVNIQMTTVANDVLRLLDSKDGDGKVEAIWESSIDEPAEDGYYICGEFSSVPSWKYAGATKMTATTGENVAYEMNFNLAVGDELRVRSYFSDRPNNEPADQWATLGDNDYAAEGTGWGVKSGDNFKATKAGYYDIYAKYENGNFMFYVAEHVDTYAISLTAKIYEGRTLVETRALESQLAYDGTPFNPSFAAISGYVSYGVYEDASCSTEYEARTFSAAGQLYLKYMRTGYYVVGDADFTGGNVGAWNAAGGVRLTTECNDPANYLEGAVTIPDVDEAVQVRPLELTGEGTVNWLDFTLGATYSFACKNGDNLEFSKSGTYAVYVKLVNYQPVVYLNEGLAAFNTKFLSEVGGVCNEVLAGTKTVAQLQSIWADQAAAYASLSATEKAEVEALTIDGGNENGSDLEKVVAKYSYIVHKYGTAVCNDFIWGQTYTAQSNGMNLVMTRNNVLLITLVSVSVLAASAGLVFYFLKKKKLVK